MKDLMQNTIKKLSAIVSSMPMPVYFGFITTDRKAGYGEVIVSSVPIFETKVTHTFKLERHFGVGCELKEFMATLSLYPKSVYYDDHLIHLDNLYCELRDNGHSIISAHRELDTFLMKNLPVTEFPIQQV
ncbi:hypothetical protein [Vibrio harveyi]|uniref:hypothetical protein n=1 Tax=Vibrio harveyi TaxID=669 RepID=UPI0025AF4DEA|nr:hypothetical protein [Vibrio harveyi]WJT11067.1 hypothetical protein PH545_28405 [Vibrio harveyi]